MNKLDKINRVEIIDHTLPVEEGGGRCYVKWAEDIEVSQSIQDDGRTLKIFITQMSGTFGIPIPDRQDKITKDDRK